MKKVRKGILFILPVIIAMMAWSWCGGVRSAAPQSEAAGYAEARHGNENCEVSAAAGIDAKAGMITEAPQVPQTVPVRRIMTTSSNGEGFSMSRIVRWYHNLSIGQLAMATDRMLGSMGDIGNGSSADAPAPLYFVKSCEYYVYALRMIVI